MIKTKIVETVEEFDENGKMIKRTVTETEETDDNPTQYTITSTPCIQDMGYDCGCDSAHN